MGQIYIYEKKGFSRTSSTLINFCSEGINPILASKINFWNCHWPWKALILAACNTSLFYYWQKMYLRFLRSLFWPMLLLLINLYGTYELMNFHYRWVNIRYFHHTSDFETPSSLAWSKGVVLAGVATIRHGDSPKRGTLAIIYYLMAKITAHTSLNLQSACTILERRKIRLHAVWWILIWKSS